MNKKQQELLIVGNWKMNPPTMGNARKLFLDIRERVSKRATNVQVAVAPPLPFILELSKLSPTGRIQLGAQDVSFEDGGAYTGEVSLQMVKSVGVTFVIVGHSERRKMGETDIVIQKKTSLVLKQKMQAILCVGESSRDKAGSYFGVVEEQLRIALQDVSNTQVRNLVIAYEPIWAIGTGKTPTPADVYEMKLFIQKVLADRFDRSVVKKVAILYGGSVDTKNAEPLLIEGQVDGFLIGGASLRTSDFTKIIDTAKLYAHGKTS
ncbi:MAG: triose-phosphate isomerase [Candidatus Paceibacterota bacterium]